MTKYPVKVPLSYVVFVISALISGSSLACQGLVFSDAWIREPPPIAKVAAGYLSITNQTDKKQIIKRVESDCCGHVMVHETVVEQEKTKMNHLSELIIPAYQTVKLRPLGKHLMLMKPKTALLDGANTTIRFHCDPNQHSEIVIPILRQ